VLTPIATSKSTVLGLRLDHDRRAWVEAAAAQAGLSVRGFFEGLIDRARLEGTGGGVEDEPVPSDAGVHPGDELATGDEPTAEGAAGSGARPRVAWGEPAERARGRTGPWRPAPRPAPEVPRLLLLPGQMLGAATAATATLIESGGRCLRDSWRVFLVTLWEGDEDDGPAPTNDR
jgi:hypothetical protein